MTDIRSILKVAAARLHATGFLARLHVVAVVIAAAALLAVVVSKLTPAVSIPWTVTAPVLVAAALLIAFAIFWRRRQDEITVAVEVDERLTLREKLSTALHVAGRDDAFARAAVEDALTVSRDARTRESVRRKFPVQLPRHWWVAPLIALVAIGCGMFLPQGDIFARDAEEKQVIRPISEEVATTLESTIEQIREHEDLANHLKDVMEDLKPSSIDPEALRTPEGDKREAIKKLSNLNEKLEELMEGEQAKSIEAFKKAMSDLKQPSEEGAVKDLMDAMANGNFEAAQQALQKMQEQAQQMEPAAAEKMAEQLQQLAQQMQQLAQQQKALEEALKEAGLDPNLAQNPQQLQQQLQQNQNLTQQQKQQLQQMAQAQQQACQMCQGLGQAMQQMAQGMQGMGQGQGGQQGQQQMQQGAQQAQQQLNNMEAIQQMLKQAQAMQGQCQGQCQGLGQGLGQQWGQGGAFGQAGRGAGGKAPIAKTPTRTQAQKADNQNEQADVISNLPVEGSIIKGQSHVAFKEAALSTAKSWAENVKDDQIPRKYREAMQHYFGQKMKEYGEGAATEGAATGEDASGGVGESGAAEGSGGSQE